MEDIRQWLISPGADARVSQWPLVGNWKIPVALSVLCESIIKTITAAPIQHRIAHQARPAVCAADVIGIPIGKRLMRDREPFNMKTPTALHSVILFMLSLYMTLECAKQVAMLQSQGCRELELQCGLSGPLAGHRLHPGSCSALGLSLSCACMSQQWRLAAAGMTNQGLCTPWVQAYENFGWKNGGRLWCNPVEKGPGFSDSGYAMARILWIHYLSKVRKQMLLQAVAMHNQSVVQGRDWPCCSSGGCCAVSQCCAAAYRPTSLLTPSS